MNRSGKLLSAALGAGLLATVAALPASAATPETGPDRAAVSRYAGSAAEKADGKVFLDAVRKAVEERRTADPGSTGAVTLVYDASGAPSYADAIAASARIWNESLNNVKLVPGTNADFRYVEGNDREGSYADTDGRGRGYVFLDHGDLRLYNPTRIVAHETGHILGLEDNYSGPCSELMSGGGPGPSCTNAYPNAEERALVDRLWANGAVRFEKAAYPKRDSRTGKDSRTVRDSYPTWNSRLHRAF